MTVRAVILGLILGVAIASAGYFNDYVLQQPYLANDLIPLAVYGLLVVGLLAINPLLSFAARRHLAAGEWAVITALMLAASVVPGPGLARHFSKVLVVPHRARAAEPGWQDKKLLAYLPEAMLVSRPADPREDKRVVAGLLDGLRPGRAIAFGEVPWYAWRQTLGFWLPVVGLSFVAGICIVLVVHPQWAYRERLRYPIAEFASELIGGAGERRFATIFHNKAFWIGFVPAVAILLINGYHLYNDRSLEIPLHIDLTPLEEAWPQLTQVPEYRRVTNPTFYFAAVGFAFLVSSDVSFSVGIGPLVWVFVFLACLRAGVDFTGGFLDGNVNEHFRFGTYLGVGLMIVFLGRRFYGDVLLRAFGLRWGQPRADSPVWACRVAVLAGVAIVAILWNALGLNPLLGGLFALLAGLTFLVIARLSVETGMFFVQPYWQPAAVILGLFGARALGPQATVTLGFLCVVLTMDPRVCLMPLAANALKITDAQGLAAPRIARWMTVAVLLAMIAGVAATIFVQYSYGCPKKGWAEVYAKRPFEMLGRHLGEFDSPDPDKPQPLRLGRAAPKRDFLWPVGIGLGAVLLCYALRLRLPWWPIHPVIFLVMGTYLAGHFAASFLLAWIVKSAVARFGGGRAYRKAKPIFIGFIAAEFAAAVFWAVCGLVYYSATGAPGPIFRVHP